MRSKAIIPTSLIKLALASPNDEMAAPKTNNLIFSDHRFHFFLYGSSEAKKRQREGEGREVACNGESDISLAIASN